jgi:hypothetical protein
LGQCSAHAESFVVWMGAEEDERFLFVHFYVFLPFQ